MRLDKNHLDTFESISPPMENALTIPVEGEGLEGVVVYVAISAFSVTATNSNTLQQKQVGTVAKNLRLLDDDQRNAITEAVEILRNTPGGHGFVIDNLERLL